MYLKYIGILYIWLIVFPASSLAVTVEDHPEQFIETHARIDWHQVGISRFPRERPMINVSRFAMNRRGISPWTTS